MLNYLKAELYKVLHRRYLYLLVALVLLGETLLSIPWMWAGGAWDFSEAVVLLYTLLPVGFFLILLLCDAVFSDQYKHNTLKNEISFGIPRARIYLGKLLTTIFVSFLVCGVLIGFYLGLNWLIMPHGAPEQVADCLDILWYCLAAALPLWLGAVGLGQLLICSVKSNLIWAILYGVIFILGAPVIFFAGEIASGPLSGAAQVVYSLLLTTPFGNLSGVQGTDFLVNVWLIGLGWLAVTTLIGLAVFRRREL